MDKQFWFSIKKNNYALPTGHNLLPLTEELYSYIGSTDPDLRDLFGFFVFKHWLRQGLYQMDELRRFIPRLLANLQKGIGETDGDSVYLRSFSALWLALIVDFNTRNPALQPVELDSIKEAALTYLTEERDLRGYDPVKGWAHAIDHAANLLSALACNPHTQANDHIRILDCIAVKLKESTHWVYIYDEDDCLAEPIVDILARGTLSLEQIQAWLNRLGDGWHDAFREEGRARAFFNGRNVIRAAHWMLSGREEISNREALQSALQDILNSTCRFVFPEQN